MRALEHISVSGESEESLLLTIDSDQTVLPDFAVFSNNPL